MYVLVTRAVLKFAVALSSRWGNDNGCLLPAWLSRALIAAIVAVPRGAQWC